MTKPLLPLLLLLSAPATSHAALTLEPYAGVGYEGQRISIGDEDFDASQLKLHAGLWLWQGIGIELELGKGLSDDTQNTLKLEHTRMLRYGVRLMTPPSPSNTVLYVLLSGATATLDMHTGELAEPGENDFDGYHTAIGMGTQITPKIQLDISYNNYQIDESFDMSGVRFNVEYLFGGAEQ